MPRKRLGEILLEEGLIDQDDLSEALQYKEKSGYRLGTALVALRIIGEWQLTEALAKTLDLPVADLVNHPPSSAALERIPSRLAERFDLIPIRLERRGQGKRLVVAMSDPLNRTVLRRMEEVAGCPVQPNLASLSTIQRAISQYYHHAAKSHVVAKAEKSVAVATASESKTSVKAAKNLIRNILSALYLRQKALMQLLYEKHVFSEEEYKAALIRVQRRHPKR
jgi:type IV pilus assembly protein PilB